MGVNPTPLPSLSSNTGSAPVVEVFFFEAFSVVSDANPLGSEHDNSRFNPLNTDVDYTRHSVFL